MSKHEVSLHPQGLVSLKAFEGAMFRWFKIVDADGGELVTAFVDCDFDRLARACQAFNAIMRGDGVCDFTNVLERAVDAGAEVEPAAAERMHAAE